MGTFCFHPVPCMTVNAVRGGIGVRVHTRSAVLQVLPPGIGEHVSIVSSPSVYK